MGNCGRDDGKPILLVFDCLSYGTHEITTMDGLKLKKPLLNKFRILSSYSDSDE